MSADQSPSGGQHRRRLRLRRRFFASQAPDELVVPYPAAESADASPCTAELEAKLAAAVSRGDFAEQDGRVKNVRIRELEARVTRLQGDIDALNKARDEAKKVVEQARERIDRIQQEMENMRKRNQRERDEMRKHAAEGLLNQLFTVLDHFTVALESMKAGASSESLLQGIHMIYREFGDVLAQNGLVPMNPLGDAFDPKYHDAVATANEPDREDGSIVQVMRPGYMLHDKVLRPAMVAVNKRPEASTPQRAGNNTPGEMVPGDIDLEIEYEHDPQADKVGSGVRGPMNPSRGTEPLDEAWKYLETRYEEKDRE